jgi:serine/threonine-protein kinase
MREAYEAELRQALAEGLVSREEADALRVEAEAVARSPLELLRERGRLSGELLASVLGMARAADATPLADARSEETLTVAPAGQRPGTGTGPQAEAAPGAPAFPLPGWERYQPVRFLGEGGMGRVFLAWDPRLRRNVALKFVRGEDAELSRRFVSEARAQARVDHERVCRVYEVGEEQGRVYIAMQYVDGQPLNVLAGALSFEQKALLVREAAEGVHAAHRAGLIHRDLKPSNVLVERTGDGALKPYVMDFGLARDWKDGVQTAPGTVLGTPHYMSPEQARGEVARLDRRADVYSLGATLYALLTGGPPISGDNGLEVLSRIASEEPRPPRALNPDVPPDLEAIALKCLEKDRALRYGSARELAEDLGRFLDGEPVHARPGPGYRLRKRLRKHRYAVGGGALALVAVLLALGQALGARREASQREALARRFTEGVERIEAQARYSGTAPFHDTRADVEALRERMRELEALMVSAGPAGEGPGHYALGRGFLVLGEEARAREHLEAAWKAGYQEPRVAYALAVVLGNVYQRRRLEAERLQDARARSAALREVEARYREPVLEFLRRSEGAEVPAPEYAAALLAFHEDRLEAALEKLAALGTRLPWFHEAPLLRGDIHSARAARRWNAGEKAGAEADARAAQDAYASAAAIGRSVPAVYRAQARLAGWRMNLGLYGQGQVEPFYREGLEAVARALSVAPDDAEAHEQEASLHRRYAEHLARQGDGVEPLLDKSREAALKAVALDPKRGTSHYELAVGLLQRARLLQEKGQDPRGLLHAASAAFRAVPPEEQDYGFFTDHAQVYRVRADYEDSLGENSLPSRWVGLKLLRDAASLDPDRPEAWMNLATLHLAQATNPRAVAPEKDLDEAEAALKKARALNPGHVVPWFYTGEVHLARAARLRDTGRDARPALAQALEAYQWGVAINRELPHLHNGVGTVLFEQAREAWERGGDPAPLVRGALKAFEEAIRLAPGQGYGQNNVGEVRAWHAGVLLQEGRPVAPEVQAARKALEDARARLPDLPQPWLGLGTVLQVEAAAAREAGRAPGAALAESEKALRRALELSPKLAQAWLALGRTQAVAARTDADFEVALRSFQKAVELEPAQPEHLLALGRLWFEWGMLRQRAGGDAGAPLEQGVVAVDAALAMRSGWPRARALRAGLLLAQAGPDAERRTRAREELARALEDNPRLRHAWRRVLAEAGGR